MNILMSYSHAMELCGAIPRPSGELSYRSDYLMIEFGDRTMRWSYAGIHLRDKTTRGSYYRSSCVIELYHQAVKYTHASELCDE